jgi:N-acetylglucosamine malate deacetylase 1
MKLDILAFGAHPDDVELSCGGTLIKHVQLGKKVGIVDLTQGELGTRGTVETRKKEAEEAQKIIGAAVRVNLMMEDGFFNPESKENLLKVIQAIRTYQPDVILANAIEDRHPDHSRGSQLLRKAAFLSGLRKVETFSEGQEQEPWRADQLYFYIQDRYIKPDFVVNISDFYKQKMDAVFAYSTQFNKEVSSNDNEPQTPISTPDFALFLEARAREMGRAAGFQFGEGFVAERTPGIETFNELK